MTAKSSTTPTGVPTPPRSSVSNWSSAVKQSQSVALDGPVFSLACCRRCPRVSSEIPNVVALPDVPAVTACRFDLAAKLLARTKISRWRLCDNIAVGQICLGDTRTRSARYPATRRRENGDVGRVSEKKTSSGFVHPRAATDGNLSLRELSSMKVSNPYLSQMERGLPSPRLGCEVDRPGTQPLGRSTVCTGWLNTRVDRARRRCNGNRTAGEPPNSPSRKRALLAVYRSYLEANGRGITDNVADGLTSPTR